jgi:crotonobetainyl-CoA:carnitine CoA-transferase CaiB-like acyl-CoA transferase
MLVVLGCVIGLTAVFCFNEYAERAVAIALREMDMVVDEHILKQKARQYTTMFEKLAAWYARNQQPENALAAFEAFRTGTVRVHTMSKFSTSRL